MFKRDKEIKLGELCRRVTEEGIIMQLLDGELSLAQENFWLDHIRNCKDCLALAADLVWADTGMKSMVLSGKDKLKESLEGAEEYFPLSGLAIDQELSEDLFSQDGEFLLAKGTQITPAIIDILLRRGVGKVCFREKRVEKEHVGATSVPEKLQATEPLTPKPAFIEPTEAKTDAAYVSRDFQEGFFFAGDVASQPRFKPESYRKLLARVSHREVISEDTKRRAFATIESSMKRLHESLVVDLEPVRQVAQEIVTQMVADESKTFSLLDIFLFSSKIYSHSFNTLVLFTALAKSMNFDKKDIISAGEAALMHDIGRVIPLSADELEVDVYRNHPTRGYRFLMKQGTFSEKMLTIVYNHHERYDGRGFPRGITGEKLGVLDQLMIVANRYDQAVTDPVHDVKRDFHKAAQLIYQSPGILVAPEIVNAFLNITGIYPPGSYVKLKSGEEGIVREANYQRPFQPNITLLKDSEGRDLPEPIEIDLRDFEHNSIERSLDVANILSTELDM